MARTFARLAGVILLAGCTIVALTGCPGSRDPWPEGNGKRILTSFAPLHCFAMNVVGDDGTVLSLMTNHGPHGYSDSPADALKLRRADLFLINGLELDNTIARKLVKSSGNKNLRLVPVGECIPEKQLLEGGCHCNHDEDSGKKHDHDHGKDPHVWLGIPEAIRMVEKIRDELKAIDPANAPKYDSRTSTYVERLKALQAEGREMLKDKKERKIVTFHDSLQYFARTFDLKVVDVIEIAPGSEPGTFKMNELIKTCEAEGVRLIAVEPQYPSNTAAKTILKELRARGIQAEFVEIDPLETARSEELDADFYETKMRQNLKNLAEKLK